MFSIKTLICTMVPKLPQVGGIRMSKPYYIKSYYVKQWNILTYACMTNLKVQAIAIESTCSY